MKTVKEWYNLYIESDDSIALMISDIQKESYNQAIENAANLCAPDERNEILKLKK